MIFPLTTYYLSRLPDFFLSECDNLIFPLQQSYYSVDKEIEHHEPDNASYSSRNKCPKERKPFSKA